MGFRGLFWVVNEGFYVLSENDKPSTLIQGGGFS